MLLKLRMHSSKWSVRGKYTAVLVTVVLHRISLADGDVLGGVDVAARPEQAATGVVIAMTKDRSSFCMYVEGASLH